MDDGGGKCEVGELCMWWRVLFCPFCCFLRFRSVLFHSLFTYLTYVPISSKNFARDMVTLFFFYYCSCRQEVLCNVRQL